MALIMRMWRRSKEPLCIWKWIKLCDVRSCCRTARFCNSGAHGGQICVSWEVVEQLLKDWGQLPAPIEPNLVAMAPIAITANYMQSVLSRQKAILEAITLRATG